MLNNLIRFRKPVSEEAKGGAYMYLIPQFLQVHNTPAALTL